MLQVKKSRAKKILGPAPCVLKYGTDKPHEVCVKKLCAHPGIEHVDLVVIPNLSPHAMPTFLTPMSTKERTYLHVTNFTDGTHTQVFFSPINDHQLSIILAADKSRITLGIFDIETPLPSVSVTSFGDEIDGPRMCFMQFGPWTWAISEELVVAEKSKQRTDGKPKTKAQKRREERMAIWFGIEVLRLPHTAGDQPDMGEFRGVLDNREPAVTVAPQLEGCVSSFSVQVPGSTSSAKILMQELPNGVSRWFSIKNGVCVWSGFGYARNAAGMYKLYWRNGSLFAEGMGFEVCVAALGEDGDTMIVSKTDCH